MMPRMASIHFIRFTLIALIAVTASCGGKSDAPATSAATPPVTALQMVTLKPGTGATIAGGQMAVVQYTGWLYEAGATDHKGKQFDSSRTAGREAFKFPVGTGSVIKGWDQGVPGMKIGESRRLTIPPELAYGDGGTGGGLIPPGATLVFDVELVGIE
jgi:FKBP-type peptidyl-prolyl cis-trans isomerase FkpA